MPPLSIDWSAVRAAATLRLALPRTPIGGRIGERLGSGTGSSLEFQDYRPYAPGDDLRHVVHVVVIETEDESETATHGSADETLPRRRRDTGEARDGQGVRARAGSGADHDVDAVVFERGVEHLFDVHHESMDFVDKKDRRSLKVMARTIQLGVAAAQVALNDGRVDKAKLDPTRFGVEFGAGLTASELPEFAEPARLSVNCQPSTIDLEKWGAAVKQARIW